jgi:YlmC/YmxH family sporulation protein
MLKPEYIVPAEPYIFPVPLIYLVMGYECPVDWGRGIMKISDFQTKDVINIVDGKKLGQVSDLELDLRQGRIDSIVVPTATRLFGMFGGGNDVVIPWRNIVKIGTDVVLVRLDETSKVYRLEDGEHIGR